MLGPGLSASSRPACAHTIRKFFVGLSDVWQGSSLSPTFCNIFNMDIYVKLTVFHYHLIVAWMGGKGTRVGYW
jgi:hypothetical protein